MCKLYHCRPSELDEEQDGILRLHLKFMELEAREMMLEQKRTEQRLRNMQS